MSDNIQEHSSGLSGLRKIKSFEAKDICRSSSHNPPTHILLSPGEYEYSCPDCGQICRFTVPLITW